MLSLIPLFDLDAFFSWDGWNAINSLTQLLLACAAFFTIAYALNKDKSYTKPKLNMNYKIGMSLWKSNTSNETSVIAGVTIYMWNMGVSSIYITDCGIQFGKGKDKPGFMCMIKEPILLNPGQKETASIYHLDLLFPDFEKEVKIKPTDKAVIYVKTGTGVELYKEIEHNYASFKYEYEQISNKAKEQNHSEKKLSD